MHCRHQNWFTDLAARYSALEGCENIVQVRRLPARCAVATLSRPVHRYPHQATLGFRFVGLAVHRFQASPQASHCGQHELAETEPTPLVPVKYDRDFGWSLTPETVLDGFREYLWNGRCVRMDLVPSLLQQVRDIRMFMQRQRSYRLYSSSLLLVYDAGSGSSHVRVRMIDFAHAVKTGGGHSVGEGEVPEHCTDTSYVKGLLGIEAALEQLLMSRQDSHAPSWSPRTR